MGKAWDNHTSYEPKTERGKDCVRFLSALGLKSWEVGFVAFIADVFSQCLRVLRPGGHGLVWALPRTSDLTCMGLRVAGWEIRDCCVHLNGSGFPKSLNVGKAIDAHLGAEREVVDTRSGTGSRVMCGDPKGKGFGPVVEVTTPATDEAKRWEGWGTALKPSSEHWWCIRKPLSGTVAQNVLEHGVGGLNIDATRVGVSGGTKGVNHPKTGLFGIGGNADIKSIDKGRWPPNTLLTHSPDCTESACVEGCVVVELGRQSGVSSSGRPQPVKGTGGIWGASSGLPPGDQHGDTGTAARYFPQFRYVPKPSRAERERGCKHLKPKQFKIKDGLTDEERAMVLARLKAAGVEI